MFILDQSGSRLFNVDDCSQFMISNDLNAMRQGIEETNELSISIRAYWNKKKPPENNVVLARYRLMEDARAAFLEMVDSISNNLMTFSFYPLPNPADNDHGDLEK